MVLVRRLAALIPLMAIGVLCVRAVGLAVYSESPDSREEAWPAVEPAALDPSTEAFVSELLHKMSLEEKIGQMIQADIASITPAELSQYKLGSILAGGNAAPGNNPHTTAQAWLELTDAFYRAALTTNTSAHPAIPIIFG